MPRTTHFQVVFASTAILIALVVPGRSQVPDVTANGGGKSEAAATTAGNAGGRGPGAQALKTQKDKLSYALGANLGNGLRRESVEVDADLLMQGLRDALSGSTPGLTQHEISVTIAGLKNELTSKRITAAAEKINAKKELAEKNKQEGDAFLADNKTRDGVITLDSGLQYKILKAGNGKRPASDDAVVCNYRGTLIDGTEFDSSQKRRQPGTFALSQVIKGWNEALQLMPVGSRWQLFIPPGLAYGERGADSGIPPNATLIFEIELLSAGHTSALAKGGNRGTVQRGPVAVENIPAPSQTR